MNESVTSSTFSSEESFEYQEHNEGNPMLASLCHFEIGVEMETLLEEIHMGRIALAGHFSLDFFVRQDFFLANCQQSRVSEELAAFAPSACCDGKWRYGIGDGQGGGPGQLKGREVYS